MNRRHFLAFFAALPALSLLRGSTAFGQAPAASPAASPAAAPAKADDKTPMVKESDPMAKSLNYCENADKGKNKICPTRKEKGREKQYCDGCQFYVAAGKRGKDEVGKCQILQNNLVKAKGWCNTFAPKAT